MNKKAAQALCNLAQALDKKGEIEAADRVDNVLQIWYNQISEDEEYDVSLKLKDNSKVTFIKSVQEKLDDYTYANHYDRILVDNSKVQGTFGAWTYDVMEAGGMQFKSDSVGFIDPSKPPSEYQIVDDEPQYYPIRNEFENDTKWLQFLGRRKRASDYLQNELKESAWEADNAGLIMYFKDGSKLYVMGGEPFTEVYRLSTGQITETPEILYELDDLSLPLKAYKERDMTHGERSDFDSTMLEYKQ